jgi:uncharacterized protein (DUF302 family)
MPGVVTLSSPHHFAATLTRLREVISAKGLTLFLDLDQQAAAKAAGLAMPPAHLLLFGNPKAGTQVMLAVPQAGLDLPLKAWVWATDGGQVYVTYNDPAYLKERFGLSDELAAALAGIAGLLRSVVE